MDEMDDVPQPPKKRGRPKGSTNKVKLPNLALRQQAPAGPREVPPSVVPYETYQPDPVQMVTELYSEVAWRLQTLRNMRKGAGITDTQSRGLETNEAAVPILIDTANVLMKALMAQQKAMAIAEELAKNKTPAQLLEIAVKKIMGQDLATQRDIIKRLRQHYAKLAPVTPMQSKQMRDALKETAAEAFANLGEED